MGHYDLFAPFYDGSVEKHYVSQRAEAIQALAVQKTSTVLDVPCGTGLSFDGLVEAGAERVIGVDFSHGMVKQATKRVAKAGFTNTAVYQGDARTLSLDDIEQSEPVDRLLICLGLTCFPDWEVGFANLWSLLAPGGRCVVMDIYAESRGFFGIMARISAQADVRRKVWEPLEALSEDFDRVELESKALHGGQIFVASGTRPAA